MNYHKIAISGNHPGLILQRGRIAFDQIEEAIATGLDVSAMLNTYLNVTKLIDLYLG